MPKPKYRRRQVPKQTAGRNVVAASNESRSGGGSDVLEDQQYVEPELPTWTKQEDVVDYLSEDDQPPSQKYACVSMLSLSKWRTERQRQDAIDTICKKEGFDSIEGKKIIDAWSDYVEPKRSFKIRGVYGTYQEAQKRSQFLQRTHKNHNVAITSVGYWVPFDPDPDKITDQNYMERELNDLHEGYMMNREKGREHFQEQAAMKAQRARVEGSKWGQEQLLKRKETKQEVEYRLKSAEEDIAQYADKIKRAELALQQAKEKLEYMKEHPEIVLDEEDTPVDHDNVPEDVMKEVESREVDDGSRSMLAEIESNRKRPNMAQGQPPVVPPQQIASAQPAQPAQSEPAQLHQMFMEPASLPELSSKGFGDDLILPHQAREQIEKVSEEFQSSVPNPMKPKII